MTNGFLQELTFVEMPDGEVYRYEPRHKLPALVLVTGPDRSSTTKGKTPMTDTTLNIEINAPADVPLDVLLDAVRQGHAEHQERMQERPADEDGSSDEAEQRGEEVASSFFDMLRDAIEGAALEERCPPGMLPKELAVLGVEWIDISTEEARRYERPGGQWFVIENPRWLYVSPDKNHYVVNCDGEVAVIHADLNRPVLNWSASDIISWVPTT